MTTFAAPVPTTLREVRLEIPADLQQPNTALAIWSLLIVAAEVVVASAIAWFVWDRGWWLAAPIAWAAGSTAMMGLFVIGHDCGHSSFLKSKRAMTIIGHVVHSPVLYPYWSWKYSHDAHHRHTNLLGRGEGGVYFDNAWTPYLTDHYEATKQRNPAAGWLYRAARWVPPFGSFLHLLWIHWLPKKFRAGRERNRVYFSMAVTVTTAIGLITTLWIGFGSPLAPLHFFVIPALLFHCWMSLYTYLHHTTPDVHLHHAETWNPFVAQMDGTVNVFTPRWISFLHFNIDVHIPHHVTTRIPSYRLRAANEALRDGTWGSIMREHPLTIRYMINQVKACHLWDAERDGFVRFDELP